MGTCLNWIESIEYSTYGTASKALTYHLAQASLSDWLNTENRVSSWAFLPSGVLHIVVESIPRAKQKIGVFMQKCTFEMRWHSALKRSELSKVFYQFFFL